MSLTSYRAAPPRGGIGICWMDWKTWRRPTLPCLETQYHGRWGFSRPSSGRDRVRAPRQSHQVVRSMLAVISDQWPVIWKDGWVLVCVSNLVPLIATRRCLVALITDHWLPDD